MKGAIAGALGVSSAPKLVVIPADAAAQPIKYAGEASRKLLHLQHRTS